MKAPTTEKGKLVQLSSRKEGEICTSQYRFNKVIYNVHSSFDAAGKTAKEVVCDLATQNLRNKL